MSEKFEEFERRRHCTHTNATNEEVFELTAQLETKNAEIEALRGIWRELLVYITLKDFSFQERILEKMEDLKPDGE